MLYRNRIAIAWAILPVGIMLLLAVVGGLRDYPFPDCDGYLRISHNLNGDYWATSKDDIYSYGIRTPGYPLLIALFHWAGPADYLIPNALALFGIILIFQRLAQHFELRHHQWAPVLFLLTPGMIAVATVPLSETVFVFFVIAALIALFFGRHVISGLCLSAATLCRPAGMFLFIIFAAWLIWKKKSWRAIILFIFCANLFQGLWTGRNYLRHGSAFYSTIGNYMLLHYKAGSYLSWKQNIPFDEMREQLNRQLPETDDWLARNRIAGRLGRQLLLENFLGFCLWAPRDMINFFMPDINPLLERLRITSGNRGTLDVLRRAGPLAAFKHYFAGSPYAMILTLVYLVYYSLLWCAIGIGFVRLLQKRQYELLVGALFFIGYFLVLPIGNLDWRFRMPATPVLLLIALYGIEFIIERFGRKPPAATITSLP